MQSAANYADEFNQKGVVDKEKAVEEFQLFPWEQEIAEYRKRDDHPNIPKMSFESSDGRQLIISGFSDAGYGVEYVNNTTQQFSDFYLSNNVEKQNFLPEEIIEFFFDNSLEQHIKLQGTPQSTEEEPVGKKSPKTVEFTFQPSFKPLLSFSFVLWVVVFVACVVISFQYPAASKWPLLFFVITWPVPVFVHLSYYLKNVGAKVIIDTQNHDLTYIKGAEEIKFNRNDIFRCQVTYSSGSKTPMVKGYSYVWFILNDRTYVIITHFVGNPYDIVKALGCKFEEKNAGVFLPVI